MNATLARWWLLSLLALGACGGEVNLGDRTDSDPSSDPTAQPPDDPYWVKTERVVDLVQRRVDGPLAVAGDFLYAAGYEGDNKPSLFRCNKTNCGASWERLPSVNEGLLSLRVFDQRLAAVGRIGSHDTFLGSYALPDATDRQVVIEGIVEAGNGDVRQARFHRGSVYWPLINDSAYYRCALPSCAPGPTKIADAWGTSPAAFDGDSVFVPSSNRFILRLAALGDGPVERLLPDEMLSVTPMSEAIDFDVPYSPVDWLATSNGMLYATLGTSHCNSNCPTQIVRWPAAGGPREELIASDDIITNLFVLDGEIVWLEETWDRAMLASCRAEACSSTLRHLGVVAMYQGPVTHDDERLYWLEQNPNAGWARAIRSVNRLPAPDGD